MTDRRATGVNRVQFDDGNGGSYDVYSMTANRVKVIAGAAISVLTLLGMIFAATRLGMGIEMKGVIEAETKPTDGIIYKAIEDQSEEFLEEVQAVIQDDLDVLEGQVQAEHDKLIRIEERQIAIQEKMDEDKAELIREIRRAGGG